MKQPTLSELKELLDDLHHEITNHGADTSVGRMAARAHEVLLWLIIDYLSPSE